MLQQKKKKKKEEDRIGVTNEQSEGTVIYMMMTGTKSMDMEILLQHSIGHMHQASGPVGCGLSA
jgi:hypothetical protein